MKMTRPTEDGAVAVIVAICLLLLFGAGALAIDLGAAWDTKRDLVVDTDAAALAGAKALADRGDCEGAVLDFMSQSLGQTLTEADLEAANGARPLCSESLVTVAWTGQAQQALSGALGAERLDVYSESVAVVVPGEGLRPMAICNNDPVVQHFVPDGNAATMSGQWVSMDRFATPGGEDSCSGAPGNWGWLCFDGTSECTGAGDLREKIEEGYQGAVTLGTNPGSMDDNSCLDSADAPNCTTEPGNYGGGSKNNAALQSITCTPTDCPIFPILVIDDYLDTGRTAVTPWGYLYITVDGWCNQGSPGGAATSGDCEKPKGKPDPSVPDRSNGVHLLVDAHALVKTGYPTDVNQTVLLCGHDGGSQCPAP